MRRMRHVVAIACVVACGSPTAEPPVRSAQQRTLDSSAAVAALRGSRFADAAREATAVLATDPRNSQAAAVHAIAAYQQAVMRLRDGIDETTEHADLHKSFDHERGRAAWRELLG